MEFLESVNDNLKSINEENITYYNLFNYPELVYGNINFASHNVNFSKLPKKLKSSITNKNQLKHMDNLGYSSYGSRIRFYTNSDKLILKVELKQDYTYDDIPVENARGFDIYTLNYDKYIHKTTISSQKNCFADGVELDSDDNEVCIFLPNFDTINNLFIGVKKGSVLKEHPYFSHNKLPIIFCGNEDTIGKNASRSGMSYPNITSQLLDQNIINLSYYGMNKPETYLASMIGKINCESIIIDYNGSNTDLNDFKKSIEIFYDKLRIYHPFKQIILLTSLYNNKQNHVIIEFYNNKKEKDNYLYLINKCEILNKNNDSHDIFRQIPNDDILESISNQICTLMKKY